MSTMFTMLSIIRHASRPSARYRSKPAVSSEMRNEAQVSRGHGVAFVLAATQEDSDGENLPNQKVWVNAAQATGWSAHLLFLPGA